MMKKDPSTEKEREKRVYQLWIEYLKRSDDYRKFCEGKEKQRRNPSHRTWIPNKYERGPEGKELDRRMEWLFLHFGNIHAGLS